MSSQTCCFLSWRMPRNSLASSAMACLTGFLLLLFITPAFNASELRTTFINPPTPPSRRLSDKPSMTTTSPTMPLSPVSPASSFTIVSSGIWQGCDGSILLDMSLYSGKPVEKSSPGNVGLDGEEMIDAAKSQLEKLCPEIVSCADIVAFAASDAVVIVGIPFHFVPSGRRDGIVSLAEEVRANLPAPFFNVEKQTEYFEKKGFSQEEMVVLVGAHSLGGAHCSSFDYRLYNFSGGLLQDPSIEPDYAEFLKLRCPARGDLIEGAGALRANEKVSFGDEAATKLDGSYFHVVQQGMGLLESDQALMKDQTMRRLVRKMRMHPRQWAEKFVAAMIKLGKLDVLTGDEGEVRKICRIANQREGDG